MHRSSMGLAQSYSGNKLQEAVPESTDRPVSRPCCTRLSLKIQSPESKPGSVISMQPDESVCLHPYFVVNLPTVSMLAVLDPTRDYTLYEDHIARSISPPGYRDGL